jgi:uncharacterized protein (TIRG00374 family)
MSVKEFSFGLIRFSVAFGILYYLLNKIPFSEVMASISSSKATHIIVSCTISIILQFVLANRLKFLCDRQGFSLSLPSVLEINITAVFYGVFLPGGSLAGGAIRFYKLSRREGKKAEALASIFLDRLTATITLCMVGILFWLADLPKEANYVGLVFIVSLGTSFLLYFFLIEKRTVFFLGEFFDFINMGFVFKKINKFSVSLNQYRHMSLSSLAFLFAISVVAHLLGVFIFYLLAESLGINLSIFTIGWIRSIVIVISMMPISVSGLGFREGALLLLLEPFGIAAEKALALSFLVLGVTVLLIAAVGGFLEGRKLLSLKSL